MSGVVQETPAGEETRQCIQALVNASAQRSDALLPLLHEIQDELGYVPAHALADIAAALNLSRAEVHGVLTFYHHFRSEPPGKTVVQVCRAEACQSMGGERLWEHACKHLNLPTSEVKDTGHAAVGGTTSDGAVTLLPVYCLGLCSSSPAVVVDAKLYARMDERRFDDLVAAARSVA